MKTLTRISKGIEFITKKVLIAIFMVMLLLVLIQVLYRYVLKIPIPWAEELARYLFTWLIFLGASLVSAQESHLSITVFQDMFPKKIKDIIMIVINVVILVFLVILTIMSFNLLIQVKSISTPVLQISMAYPYLSVVLGSLFMSLHTLVNIINKTADVFQLKSSSTT